MTDRSLHYVASSTFEAARLIKRITHDDVESSLHGHSFLVRVRANATASDHASLQSRLADIIRPLDHQFLNNHITDPTDTALANWVSGKFRDLSDFQCAVRSSSRKGAFIDSLGLSFIWESFRFEAAHWLPNVPEDHPCARLHGHGFEVFLYSELNQDLQGSQNLSEHVVKLRGELHGLTLNHLPGLENPTSELLAAWIWDRVTNLEASLVGVIVMENTSSGCHYNGESHQIWKDIFFEAAVPSTSSSEVLGHSYSCRLHLCSVLDDTLGWTVDYGEVKAKFDQIYDQLDHRFLGDLSGLEESSLEGLVRWIEKRAVSHIPLLNRLDLYETPGCGICLILPRKSDARELLIP